MRNFQTCTGMRERSFRPRRSGVPHPVDAGRSDWRHQDGIL